MGEADDDWACYGGGQHAYAQKHATEQSALYKLYVTDTMADAPVPASSGGDGAGPSDAADDDAPTMAPPALDADTVVAELRKLFTAAKGLSLSVLIASRLQERRGNAQLDYDEYDSDAHLRMRGASSDDEGSL
jgi:hypothetical protein